MARFQSDKLDSISVRRQSSLQNHEIQNHVGQRFARKRSDELDAQRLERRHAIGPFWTRCKGQSWSGRFATNTYVISNASAYKYYKLDNLTPSKGCSIVSIADIKLIENALNSHPSAVHGENAPADDHLQLSGVTQAHDPSTLIKDGDHYYYFSTGEGILSRSSTDLKSWTAGPPVFRSPLPWWTDAVPGWHGQVWAPDVAYFNGQYYLYYSISLFGKQISAIGLATNPTLDPNDAHYRWTDHGAVIQSHDGDSYNAIDPCIFRDEDGSLRLTFGSYWNGIYIVSLDSKTGKLQNAGSTTQASGKKQFDRSLDPVSTGGLLLSVRQLGHLLPRSAEHVQYPRGPRRESDGAVFTTETASIWPMAVARRFWIRKDGTSAPATSRW